MSITLQISTFQTDQRIQRKLELEEFPQILFIMEEWHMR